MIEGNEILKTYTNNCLTSTGKYNEENDIELWNDGTVSSQIILVPGSMIIVHNNQPHKCAIISHRQENVKKLVCKIKI
jgi:YhcH/YjgK/YiaL family protein